MTHPGQDQRAEGQGRPLRRPRPHEAPGSKRRKLKPSLEARHAAASRRHHRGGAPGRGGEQRQRSRRVVRKGPAGKVGQRHCHSLGRRQHEVGVDGILRGLRLDERSRGEGGGRGDEPAPSEHLSKSPPTCAALSKNKWFATWFGTNGGRASAALTRSRALSAGAGKAGPATAEAAAARARAAASQSRPRDAPARMRAT